MVLEFGVGANARAGMVASVGTVVSDVTRSLVSGECHLGYDYYVVVDWSLCADLISGDLPRDSAGSKLVSYHG